MESKYAIAIKWLSVTCFEIRFDDLTIVTDPFITECVGTDLTYEAVDSCNIICLSHAHWDHITDIPRLAEKFNPIIMCGEQTAMPLARWLNYNPSLVYPMYPDMELDFDSVKIRSLYGRHKALRAGMNDLCRRIEDYEICQRDSGIRSLQALGCFEYRNFLFTAKNGTRILLWGNDPTVEQVNLCKALKPDIAIIQRAKDEKEIARRAEFAAKIGAKVLIPHHADFQRVDDPAIIQKFREEFLKRVPDGEFITPIHGEWIHL